MKKSQNAIKTKKTKKLSKEVDEWINYQNFFDGHELRIIEKDNEIWFVAKDVCEILEISNPSMAIQRLDDDERAKFNLGRQGLTNQNRLMDITFTDRRFHIWF